jgi:SecD/SecF fusion protein
MHPLRERDFYETFRSIWQEEGVEKLSQVESRARQLQEIDPQNYEYPSEAIEKAAEELDIDMTTLVNGENLADNKDVIALVRALSRASIRRGLDLNGGAEFIMKINPDAEFTKKMEAAAPEEKERLLKEFANSRDQAIEILRTRLESKKIYEVEIYPMGEDLISLRIPVVSKAEKVRLLDMIKMSAQLRSILSMNATANW